MFYLQVIIIFVVLILSGMLPAHKTGHYCLLTEHARQIASYLPLQLKRNTSDIYGMYNVQLTCVYKAHCPHKMVYGNIHKWGVLRSHLFHFRFHPPLNHRCLYADLAVILYTTFAHI